MKREIYSEQVTEFDYINMYGNRGHSIRTTALLMEVRASHGMKQEKAMDELILTSLPLVYMFIDFYKKKHELSAAEADQCKEAAIEAIIAKIKNPDYVEAYTSSKGFYVKNLYFWVLNAVTAERGRIEEASKLDLVYTEELDTFISEEHNFSENEEDIAKHFHRTFGRVLSRKDRDMVVLYVFGDLKDELRVHEDFKYLSPEFIEEQFHVSRQYFLDHSTKGLYRIRQQAKKVNYWGLDELDNSFDKSCKEMLTLLQEETLY